MFLCFPGYAYAIDQEQQSEQEVLHATINESYVDSLLKHGTEFMNREDRIHNTKDELTRAYQYSRALLYHDGIIKSCKALGNYYIALSDNENATRYFYLFMKEAEAVKDTSYIAEAYIRLALVMYNMNKWQESLNYLNTAEAMLREVGGPAKRIELITYLNGVCHVQLGNYSIARNFLEKAKSWAFENADSMRYYEVRLALNTIKAANEHSDEVYKEFDAISNYFISKGEKMAYCFTIKGRSKALLSEGRANEAYIYASEALEIARSMNLIYPITELLATLIETERQRGNYESAFKYLSELKILNDSTNSMEVATQVTLLGATYQFEKKTAAFDAEIQAKNRQKRFFVFMFLVTFLVALVIVFVLRLVGIQRKKLDLLLHNILPRHTVMELQKGGHSIPKAHKDVTIVFADVESFTKIASTLKPDNLVKMLDRYFGQFDKIITKYGLEKIKTIGDAYMFVTGLTEDSPSAHRAADACLEMIESIHVLRDEIEEKYGNYFDFRFGMHTGNVVSGVVGDIKYAFDIWGDAVNIAARMEETSETGKINISQDTMRILKDEYICTPRGSFNIKNRGVVEMYFLEGKIN